MLPQPKTTATALLIAALFLAAPAFSEDHAHSHHAGAPDKTAQTPQAVLATGQGIVKHLDPARLRLTLAHEAIEKLNWPAMTMSFAVTDKSLLNGLKVGDTVRFELQDETTIRALQKRTDKK
ncbi:MAG: copper-binding protein [Zoogloeaceae bacterium]|jgi:Cu(I)/Ag(I) efflux system protein CusF|nr:copper-binding protein [Zoogloeaceae bacterium]